VSTELPLRWRDGTSQSGRLPPELDPDYARVDERTTRDLLDFALQYAYQLNYFGRDPDQAEGDWRLFIAETADLEAKEPDLAAAAPQLDAAARYAAAPETFPAQQAGRYARPHFALFLAFLELLGQARGQLNALTRRHLEFFYRDVLGMFRKRAVPDRVHVLVELDPGTAALALPAGTALDAGKDSLGVDLAYRTERELVANRVQVAQVSALRAETRVTGIKEASRQYRTGGTPKDAFVAMLKIALGRPAPGDSFPLPNGAEVSFEALEALQKLVEVVERGLGMPLFDDLRKLVRLKQLRKEKEAGEWQAIDKILEEAGKRRKAGFTLDPGTPQIFEARLEAALGKKLAGLFDGLPEAKNVDEAYALLDEEPDAAEEFLAEALAPLKLGEFSAVMKLKQSMDDDWEKINALLERAAKHKDAEWKWPGEDARASHDFGAKLAAAGLDLGAGADFSFAQNTGADDDWKRINKILEDAGKRRSAGFKLAPKTPPDFEAHLEAALGRKPAENVDQAYARLLRRPDDPEIGKSIAKALSPLSLEEFKAVMAIKTALDMDRYYAALLEVERRFYMSAENFKYVMSSAPRGSAEEANKWDGAKTYEILAAAHRKMIYQARRDTLEGVAKSSVKPLRDMLAVVMGDKDVVLDDALLQKLGGLGVAASDLAYLTDIKDNRVAKPDWASVAAVLEVAQRNREGLEEPVAQTVEWRNLYPAADARQGLARWKTFGRGERALEPKPASAPPASFGWAMTSPLLALAEGRRTIKLALGFAAGGPKIELAGNPFQVELSTAKGWVAPKVTALEWAKDGLDHPRPQGTQPQKLATLVLDLELAAGEPAAEPLAREVHGIDTPAPVLRLMVKPVWDDTAKCYVTTSYQRLRQLSLVRTRLTVSAFGLARLSLANDQGALDAKKPFEPFGAAPAVGSRLHLGHPEVVGRKLDSLTFNITWMGAPADLAAHYKNYSKNDADFANQNFKAKVLLAEGGVLRDFGVLALFAPLTLVPPPDQGNPDNADAGAAEVTDWNRRLVWELTPLDFQHAVYPRLALQKSLDLAAAVTAENAASLAAAAKPDPPARPAMDMAPYRVNPPYTPKIKSLTLDYQASAELVLDAAARGSGALRAFHVEPFGYAELKPGTVPGCPFLPRYDFAGELYIGLRNVAPPQNVSLLFQVAEGSANPDLAPDPVRWSYLSGNEWRGMEADSLLADGTRGLINSGIVELALKPAQPSTRLLPAELYWIRAAIAQRPDCVCDMVEIHPNAVPARFADQGNAPDHLKTPLPPERIKGPVVSIPGMARVLQPYPSFGGKMAEQDASFYVRVSERLRHKERALTAWDYERLVLEKFPQLYKVKCLRSSGAGHAHAPGRIELIVIPDIRNRLPFNPFEPKAPADLIRDIEAFLRDKTPPFARVEVKNARYVPVKVRCGVRFVPGADESFCRARLNDELNRFLSPWAYEEGADLVIGGSVYANSIINFIDSRDYVDYIAEFWLFTSEDGGRKFDFIEVPRDGDYRASAKTPDGILVAALEHEFDVISDADYRVERLTGIDYMRVELDFRIAESDRRPTGFAGIEYWIVELDFKVS
jgi:hypothetical protein